MDSNDFTFIMPDFYDPRFSLKCSKVNLIIWKSLYDIFHELSEPERILEELHRVLKPDGILSFRDHHMEENEIISRVTKRGLIIQASEKR